jgi:hypothetical protein
MLYPFRYRSVLNLLVFILTIPAAVMAEVDEHQHEQHGAHVHGMAEVTIVLEQGQLLIQMVSPAVNVLGYEHASDKEMDKSVQSKVRELLRDAGKILSFTGTECLAGKIEVHMPSSLAASGVKEDVHTDIEASYEYVCDTEQPPESLVFSLLQTFPGIERISVQWIFNGIQGSSDLTADRNKIVLP